MPATWEEVHRDGELVVSKAGKREKIGRAEKNTLGDARQAMRGQGITLASLKKKEGLTGSFGEGNKNRSRIIAIRT